eukprot:CAMPEP_0202701956 /NCGR_PEP_ID=MMETSP1385-20130828/15002_1 /ASSEMBLY_ACC=CAM_ASM_000861 /TAXON_ID=933848 /ORGANISM="Elphidium margaritaceum" /LENGTH=283 /DNA_ID=CAMNT_0049359491 /DNA_START=1 /DNA_END=848 /DNA_ORIENTATION=+
MKLYHTSQSKIITTLQSFSFVKIDGNADYDRMVEEINEEIKKLHGKIVTDGLINTKAQRNAKQEHYAHFSQLHDQLSALKSCSQTLKDHIQPSAVLKYHEKCIEKLINDLEGVINGIQDQLRQSMEDDRQLEEHICDYIGDHHRILLALNDSGLFYTDSLKNKLKKAFNQISALLKKKVSKLEQDTKQIIDCTVDWMDNDEDLDNFIQWMGELEMMSTIFIDFQDMINMAINGCLQHFKEQHPGSLKVLYSALTCHKSSWACSLVQRSIFLSVGIERFNKFSS